MAKSNTERRLLKKLVEEEKLRQEIAYLQTKDWLSSDEIKRLSKLMKVSIQELLALTPNNDVFYIQKNNIKNADWVFKIWDKMKEKFFHPRGMYYRVVGKTINNQKVTPKDWSRIKDGVKFAGTLDLIPYRYITDEKNNPLVRNQLLTKTGFEYEDSTIQDCLCSVIHKHNVKPELVLSSPEKYLKKLAKAIEQEFALEINQTLLQPFYIEIWCEKTGVIPEEITQDFQINVREFQGDASNIACYEAIQEARRINKPLLVLYFSDLDANGYDMPKSSARKLEKIAERMKTIAFLYKVALTPEQQADFQLPETPSKSSTGSNQTKADNFTQHFGVKAVEINAFLEQQPEMFKHIIKEAIEQFLDKELPERIEDFKTATRKALRKRIKEFLEANKDAIVNSTKAFASAIENMQKEIKMLEQKYSLRAKEKAFKKALMISGLKNNALQELNEIQSTLNQESEIEIPSDILLDTRRSYYEQLQHYKKYDYRTK